MAECGAQAEGGRRRREAGLRPHLLLGRAGISRVWRKPEAQEAASLEPGAARGVCRHTRSRTHTCTHTHSCTHTLAQTCTHPHIHSCDKHMYPRTYAHTCAHAHTHTHAHVPTYATHACTLALVHTCTPCTHTHTHTDFQVHTHTALHSTHTHTRVNTPVRVPSGETLLCASPAAASPAWPCPGHSPSRGGPRAAGVSLSPALLLSCMSLALQGPAGTFRLCPSAAPAHPRENRIVIALSV